MERRGGEGEGEKSVACSIAERRENKNGIIREMVCVPSRVKFFVTRRQRPADRGEDGHACLVVR